LIPNEADVPNSLEWKLVWDGVEDYAGLWEAEALAREAEDAEPDASPRVRARRALAALLEQGLIVLYTCRGLPTKESVVPVPPADRAELFDADSSWTAPGEADLAVWYEATDQGFAAYREANGWAW
jgi:hypothetical protein